MFIAKVFLWLCAAFTMSSQVFAQDGAGDVATYSLGPEMTIWNTLRSVRLEGDPFDPMPDFPKEIKSLNGSRITIKGYIIPVEEAGSKQGNFVLSLLPYSSCFFCGGAGPETVIEVKASAPIPYTTRPVTLSGTFKLNPQPGGLFYLLTEAVRTTGSN
jgi:hypothetical protein